MRRSCRLALAVFVVASAPAFGQDPEPAPNPGLGQNTVNRPVVIAMSGDHKVNGLAAVSPLSITTEYGKYEVDPTKIKSVEVTARDRDAKYQGESVNVDGSVVTATGETLKGTITWNAFPVLTSVGVMYPNPFKIKTITFTDVAGDRDRR